jgi:hypothetical protein
MYGQRMEAVKKNYLLMDKARKFRRIGTQKESKKWPAYRQRTGIDLCERRLISKLYMNQNVKA